MAKSPVRGDPLRAVIFDVDGTLYRQAPVRRAMLARLVRAHAKRPVDGVRVARVLSAYRRAQESLRVSGFEGDLSAAQADAAARRAGVEASVVVDCVAEWMETSPLDVVRASARTGLIEALDALAARGVQLGAVSDYPARRKLEALGIADRFDTIVTAQDPRVHVFKPNPRGLLVAAADLGVRPEEALYVGDRADVDAPAAAAAGMPFLLVGGRRRATGGGGRVGTDDLAMLIEERA